MDTQLPTPGGLETPRPHHVDETSPHGGRWRRLPNAFAGAAAAGAALAAGDLVTARSTGPTPVTAIGTEFIDRYAARLKDLAIRLFGTNDKRALLIGIVVAAVVIGAGLGLVQRRWRFAVPLGFVAFGALGAWAMKIHPLGGDLSTALLTNGLAAMVGIATFWLVLAVSRRTTASGFAPGEQVGPSAPAALGPMRAVTFDRRRFAAGIGGAVIAAAGAGQIGRVLRRNDSRLAIPQSSVIPRPQATVPTTTPTMTTVADAAPAAAESFDIAGLSSYITPNDDFYRIDTALQVPLVDSADWELTIDGMVDTPLTFTYDELLALPSVEHTATIACVSNEINGNLVGNAVWQGVLLADLLEQAGVDVEATQIVGHSVDGFTAGFPTDVAFDGRTALVAYAMNGEPLPREHGYPVRLIVPGLYGYVSATKWLSRIELTRWEDLDGYWITRGWSKEGPIKTMSRIDVPKARDDVAAGTAAIAGVAWAPDLGIERVEVQIDDGEWIECELGKVVNDDTWVQWKTPWEATAGEHTIRSRATDRSGYTQTDEVAPVAPDGASGYPTRTVRVE